MRFYGFFEDRSPFDLDQLQTIFCEEGGKVIAQTQNSVSELFDTIDDLLDEDSEVGSDIGNPMLPSDWTLVQQLPDREDYLKRLEIVIEFMKQHKEYIENS